MVLPFLVFYYFILKQTFDCKALRLRCKKEKAKKG